MSSVTGEHVHIELIQLSGDYKGNLLLQLMYWLAFCIDLCKVTFPLVTTSLFFVGGKVVARHEEKAHRFLFPSDQEDKLREVVMTKGRRYEVGLLILEHVNTCNQYGPSFMPYKLLQYFNLFLVVYFAIWMWYINLCR